MYDYETFESVFLSVLNKHAPLKKTFVRGNQAPYMTKQLRKAIMRRSELESNSLKNRIIENFCSVFYKKERKKFYPDLDLNKITDNELFWKTIKLFLSDTCLQSSTISLVDNKNVISGEFDLAKIFNSYFEKTVIELGIKRYENFDTNPDSKSLDNVDITINKYKNHLSIALINENVSFESRFNLKGASESDIQK